MTERSVRVLHLVVPRRAGDGEQILLYPHPRWRDPKSGRPLLTLPATGIGPGVIGDRIAGVLGGDLGLPENAFPDWRRLADAEARLVSPTLGVPTAYSIASACARIPAADHGRTIRRLRGEWLAPTAALALDDLSPTARTVIAALAAGDRLLPAIGPAAELDTPHWALTARLLAARDGDFEEYAKLLETVRPLLRERLRKSHWTRSMARRIHEVEDVIAEAALRALQKLELFDPTRGNALVWLWTITRNLAISRLRARGRLRSWAAAEAEAVADGERGPADLFDDRDEIAALGLRLRGILNGSDPRLRSAWEMLTVDGRTYREIAAVLGVPQGTVGTWIWRIRRELKSAD